MTRTTPELVSPSKHLRHTSGRAVGPLRMIKSATGSKHDGSSVESGFEREAIKPQSRDLGHRCLRKTCLENNCNRECACMSRSFSEQQFIDKCGYLEVCWNEVRAHETVEIQLCVPRSFKCLTSD
ncbi:hypothetical protein AVEN_14987-1 [Araneus ventricosus]|uniref:Uncharacterized protein n=1 Tax=Araneus ventricosus TaxID=182803 RepID=A0A4Y2F758_ARAVE|nr:hypothetical protein AVEN_14987-1 [Araneus ventricosus]